MSVLFSEAVSAVRAMLEDREVKYTDEESRPGRVDFFINYRLSHTKLNQVRNIMSVVASKKNPELCNRIICYCMVGIKADDDYITEVAEFLHRANYGLTFGNFELDFSDGEIRYKMALNCVDALPGNDAIEDALYIPMSMFERYGDGLLGVAMGLVTPEEAIDKIEN